MKKRVIVWAPCALLLGLTLWLSRPAVAEPEEPVTPLAENASAKWRSAIQLTNDAGAPLGATQPFVQAAPDGKTVLVLYSMKVNATPSIHNIVARRSVNNGASWAAPQLVHASAGADSLHVNFAYDANSRAHAVWREGQSLVYKREDNWAAATAPVILSNIDNSPLQSPGANNPIMVASGANTLDVVWWEGSTTVNGNIFHRRSTNGGANWSAKQPLAATPATSELPSLAIDRSGRLHAVWQENLSLIYYAQSTSISGANVTWSTPAPITANTITAREPKIITDGSRLYVSFTRFEAKERQSVYHIRCSTQCTVAANWTAAGQNPVSGPFVGANQSNPFNVASSLIRHQGCTLVYFHGTSAEFVQENELIWGVDSCSGWNQGRERLTAPQKQALFPTLATQNNWWLYLVYEEGDTNLKHHIYFMRNDPAVHLPIIFK